MSFSNSFSALTWLTLPLMLLGVACGSADYEYDYGYDYDYPEEEFVNDDYGYQNEGNRQESNIYRTASNQSSPSDRWVDIVDKGFNMTIHRERIPEGWQVYQDISTNMNAGGYQSFIRDIYGPQGQVIRDFGNATFNATFGITLEAIVQKAVQSVVQQPNIGQARPSQALESLHEVQAKRQTNRQLQMELKTFEVPFSGVKDGKSMEGLVYLMLVPYHQLGNAGFVEIELVAAPSEIFAEAQQTSLAVLKSREFSSEYIQRKNQHNGMASRQSAKAHQNRMAQLRSNHQAHQARMKDMYAANDARHQSYMNNLRSTPTNTGSSYSSHDAFIDQIHERTTFNDPYSGQEIHQDGQYDYWYTDGLGNYHGTNDPSFNPHSLQGNWQAISPNRPNGW